MNVSYSYSGESQTIGINTLTEAVDDIAIVYFGGDVSVEDVVSEQQYVLNARAEDPDGRTSSK